MVRGARGAAGVEAAERAAGAPAAARQGDVVAARSPRVAPAVGFGGRGGRFAKELASASDSGERMGWVAANLGGLQGDPGPEHVLEEVRLELEEVGLERRLRRGARGNRVG